MYKVLSEIITKIFVDNVFLHKFVSCHRLPDRSFFIRNRQFHICARCTGLLVGLVLSISLLLLPIKNGIAYMFPFFLTILVMDGFTQRLNLRQSNNGLRLLTGITTGAAFLPFISISLIYIYERI